MFLKQNNVSSKKVKCRYQLPCDVSKQKTERFLGRPAEVLSVDGRHDVGVPIDELHELLQTEEATFAAAENGLRKCFKDILFY